MAGLCFELAAAAKYDAFPLNSCSFYVHLIDHHRGVLNVPFFNIDNLPALSVLHLYITCLCIYSEMRLNEPRAGAFEPFRITGSE